MKKGDGKSPALVEPKLTQEALLMNGPLKKPGMPEEKEEKNVMANHKIKLSISNF